jgi:hypothetical protein
MHGCLSSKKCNDRRANEFHCSGAGVTGVILLMHSNQGMDEAEPKANVIPGALADTLQTKGFSLCESCGFAKARKETAGMGVLDVKPGKPCRIESMWSSIHSDCSDAKVRTGNSGMSDYQAART